MADWVLQVKDDGEGVALATINEIVDLARVRGITLTVETVRQFTPPSAPSEEPLPSPGAYKLDDASVTALKGVVRDVNQTNAPVSSAFFQVYTFCFRCFDVAPGLNPEGWTTWERISELHPYFLHSCPRCSQILTAPPELLPQTYGTNTTTMPESPPIRDGNIAVTPNDAATIAITPADQRECGCHGKYRSHHEDIHDGSKASNTVAAPAPSLTLQDIQRQVGQWVRREFWEDDTPPLLSKNALKICEEAGEVARAVGRLEERRHRDNVDWSQNVREELADVVITCLSTSETLGIDLFDTLVNRWQVVGQRQFASKDTSELGK